MAGPLSGIKVIEMQGIGPGPFAGMVFADLGAEVIRIDRLSSVREGAQANLADFPSRGKKSVALDLKNAEHIAQARKLIASADVLIEGFRPSVMERLGLGPEICLSDNPRLIYGRMTGWGQHGDMAQAAGHDLNYIALSGALGAMGRAGEPPAPPLNLVGDFGGGAMLLLVGVLAALHEVKISGKGQVVDAAMTDGTALLMTLIYSMKAMGVWQAEQQSNLLDGAAHFYDCYTCSDGKYISVGSIEPQFYQLLLEKCGLTEDPAFAKQHDRENWPQLKQALTELFLTQTRDHWCDLMEGTDICFAPVLDMEEAPKHHHNQSRQTFVLGEDGKNYQPAPAPRFSRTSAEISGEIPVAGQHNSEILSNLSD